MRKNSERYIASETWESIRMLLKNDKINFLKLLQYPKTPKLIFIIRAI